MEVLQSKVEVLEKKESKYSEASFKNSLKNDQSKKKDKKKSDDEDATDDQELTDEEKDALDYQLQRGMDMVIAMSKMQKKTETLATEEKKSEDKSDEKK